MNQYGQLALVEFQIITKLMKCTKILKFYTSDYNKEIKVLYGGSVNLANISNILDIPNVDGVFWGCVLRQKFSYNLYSTVKHLQKTF